MNDFNKKKILVKRFIYNLFLVLIVAIISSCQKTPEELIVKQKDGEALLEAIGESEVEQEEIAPYEANNTWAETIEGATGQFNCIIDASVEVPDLGVFPVMYVEPKQFTADFIKSIVYHLLPEGISLNIYDKGSISSHTLTKEQIEGAILSIQETINNPESFLNKIKETNPEAYRERLSIEMEALEEYRTIYETAPDEIAVESLVITDEIIKNTFAATNIPPAVSSTDDYEGIPNVILKVADCDADGGIYNKVGLVIKKATMENSKSVTNNEAIEISKKIISDLYIEDMTLTAILEPDIYNKYLTIYFSRNYEGIPTTYTTNQISLDSDAGTYSYPWFSESIEIKLYQNGELRSFTYTSPLSEGKVLSKNVNLLDFSETQDIFRKQIIYEGIYIEDDSIIKREYHINSIKLGMMRVAVKNETNKYMVIPVWDFFGYYVDTYDSQEHTQWQLDEKNQVTQNDEDPYYSVLTINAIDGSIIDRSLGY